MSNYRRLFIQNSYLFLVITTNYRRPILIDNIELLRESFKRAKQTYNFEIFGCVILPDHMHLIIRPENIEEYPKIIFAIKYHFSRKINDGGLGNPPYEDLLNPNKKQNYIYPPPYATTNSKQKKNEKGIWQRRYWEHTIRDDEDLYKHLDYIHYNPVKHGLTKNVKDWEYSSFFKFVEMRNYDLDWGSSKDIKHIEEMNYD